VATGGGGRHEAGIVLPAALGAAGRERRGVSWAAVGAGVP